MKLDKALQIIGAVALWAFDRWREGSTARAERRHLRKLRQAERRDEERPVDRRPGFARKGDA
jgi:hypothetical protein